MPKDLSFANTPSSFNSYNIKYETVIGWRRQGYRLSWMKLSLRKTIGRPAVDPKVKTFLKQMA